MRDFRRLTVVLAVAVLAACVVGAGSARQHATVGYPFKEAGHWGKTGTATGQFQSNALGLATDKAGKVYSADTDNLRIQVFTPTGGFVRALAFEPETTVQDVAVDPAGNAWGTDPQGSKLQQFGPSGQPGVSVPTTGSAIGIGIDARGSLYVSTLAGGKSSVTRFDAGGGGFQAAKSWGGFQDAGDVEASADGSVYVADRRGSPPTVKRFDANGKPLKTIKTQLPATAGAGAQFGIAVDLDCNLWMTNIPQRNLVKVSPTGTVLATVAAADLIAQDVAVGPKGDLYAFDSGQKSIVRFTEDRSKPLPAVVAGVSVAPKGSSYVARVRYTAAGIACPAQLTGTASLKGTGVTGKATVKVPAGRPTVVEIPLVKAALVEAAGTSVSTTFTIVLATNGRTTTHTTTVNVAVPKTAK